MADDRFAARLNRIQAKQKTPKKSAQPELLAGVGDVKHTRTTLKAQKTRLMPYIALGLVVGYGSYLTLNEFVGMETLLTTPPERLLELGLADPRVGAAGAALLFCATLAFLSLFLGKRGLKARGFSWAAVVSVVGGAVVAGL